MPARMLFSIFSSISFAAAALVSIYISPAPLSLSLVLTHCFYFVRSYTYVVVFWSYIFFFHPSLPFFLFSTEGLPALAVQTVC